MIAKEHIMATAAAVSVGVGIGVVVGWLIRGRFRSFALVSRKAAINREIDLNDNSPSPKDDGEYKMVIVVRTDLKMGRGKAAAQCAHGALGAAEKCLVTDKDTLYAWKACGQPKVVVKTDTEQSLIELAKAASASGLICTIIRDAGRTQIASGSKTVLAVGPGPAQLIDKVTGHLKLY
ncbi:peptidyl-tRNA hydrolase 2, mitochondrial-like isoform X1 [Dreissena polymorpha]|uniref:peptidyl-tRNA hydrolase 2, mitochondrial-like isoform X1 n=1 Tax=Dreissena polymorpha TaxID=45954 RepID=UPI00226418C5|nr:peptidyl-tRNA hydrolase 2, mitochondrial-like isoform X1 [Dreissena polymorpha]